MESNNEIFLSDKIIELLKQRRVIKKEKEAIVKTQKYEEAARVRDKERQLEEKILEIISEEGKYDFTKSKQMKKDILTILNLVEEDDADFSNAINKLSRVDLERIKLMRDIEKYTKGIITLDDLHGAIKTSFELVNNDYKNRVQRTLMDLL